MISKKKYSISSNDEVAIRSVKSVFQLQNKDLIDNAWEIGWFNNYIFSIHF